MSNDFNDFGFTAVDEDDLESVQQLVEEKVTNTGLQERLDELYSAIMPLLGNLASNSERDYIHWPNRLSKIEEFRDKLTSIYKGNKI